MRNTIWDQTCFAVTAVFLWLSSLPPPLSCPTVAVSLLSCCPCCPSHSTLLWLSPSLLLLWSSGRLRGRWTVIMRAEGPLFHYWLINFSLSHNKNMKHGWLVQSSSVVVQLYCTSAVKSSSLFLDCLCACILSTLDQASTVEYRIKGRPVIPF